MKFWYRKYPSLAAIALWPLSLVFHLIAILRRLGRNRRPYPTPIVVVGNLTVGGTGKTPTVIWLCRLLKEAGYRVAVVSRGYRAKAVKPYPIELVAGDRAAVVGDEPLLILTKTGAQVVIDPDRHRAVKQLTELPAQQRPDIIVSDDGLQHYRMFRDIELVMLDPQTGLGNGLLLPAGPLREPSDRLQSVDYLLAKHQGAALSRFHPLVAKPSIALARDAAGTQLPPQPVIVCAAIGNIDSFLYTLATLGYEVTRTLSFADHQPIPSTQLATLVGPVLITEKDLVKLEQVPENVYVVPFELDYGKEFGKHLLTQVKQLIDEKSRYCSGSL